MKKTIALVLLLSSSLAFAGTTSLEGTVKDARGNKVQGADVKIEAKNGKSIMTKTDANGHYICNGLAVGNYHVTLLVNGVVKASILNAKAQAKHPTELNFDLTNTRGPRKLHMVYVPTETGTHIGSGRWITVDENGNVVGENSNVQKLGTEAINQMQMNANGSRSAKDSH